MMVQHRAAAVGPAHPSPSVEEAGASCKEREDRSKAADPEERTDAPSSHVLVIPTTTTTSTTAAATTTTSTARSGGNSIRKALKLARTYSRPLKLLLLLLVVISLATTTSNLLKLFVPLHATLQYYLVPTSFPRDSLSSLSRLLPLPPTLDHGLSDEQLFWRASFTPHITKYPFDRVPKVAFMFLARGHLPLYPLWERFLAGNEGLYSLYIHSSLSGYQPEYPTGSPFYGRQIPSKVAEWGEMSMMDAERRLLANALLDINNERFVLLSETCIPLHNFTIVHHYLTASLHSFVGVYDDPGPFGLGRYDPRMAPLVPANMWRKGSQWFELDRDTAVAVVSDSTYYPLFRDYCRPACYVDEHYLPTMLTIEMPQRTANRSVTLVDWSRGGPHPATFGADDLKREGFLKRIVDAGTPCPYNGNQEDAVCHLFARKFAPSALQPLLQLAPTVLGF